MENGGIADLLAAVGAGDVARAEQLLQTRPALATTDTSANDERRALHFAVLQRDARMVKLLMAAGADPDQGVFPHRDATTPRLLASDRGFDDISVLLAERLPATASTADSAMDPETAWERAMRLNDADAVRRLLAAGEPWPAMGRKGGLLSLAVRHQAYDAAALLIAAGADVDERWLLPELETATESWGYPLWRAAQQNDYRMAQLLLEAGADPNGNVYASGWPLSQAWWHDDQSLKQLLLAHGARVEPYLAVQTGDVAEARRRMEEDASDAVAWEFAVPAAEYGEVAILELALARLDAQDTGKRWNWLLIQPIRGSGQEAAENETRLQCFELLLRWGVPADAARLGQTALHFTAGRQGVAAASRLRFAAMLLDAGAQLDSRDELLQATPLAWACRWGRLPLVQFLLARGADAGELSAPAWTRPRAWAARMEHTEIVALLDVAGTAASLH